MIAITGAAGKTGRAVTSALSRRGLPVRALVHCAKQMPAAHAAGAVSAQPIDVTDTAALADALRDVDAVYHIAPNVHPDELGMGRALIDAARRAGVGRVVFHSVLRPQLRAMSHHEAKLRVEEALFVSGLAVTVLQPAPYQQNVLDAREAITRDGDYPVPYRVDAPFAVVDLRDVAEAAALVLAEEGHVEAVYELAGPESLSPRQMAGCLSAVLGRSVTARQVSRQDWQRSAERRGLSQYAVETLLSMFRHYDAHGLVGNPRVLAGLLGRAPTAFEEFARASVLAEPQN